MRPRRIGCHGPGQLQPLDKHILGTTTGWSHAADPDRPSASPCAWFAPRNRLARNVLPMIFNCLTSFDTR